MRRVPPFPLPADTADAARVHVYATGAPSVNVPLYALGSTGDKIWPWDLPSRWADVASGGFRLEQVEAIAHFKLMVAEPVVTKIVRELCAAAMAQARFG